ncbi:sodium/glutamate symporter [Pseudoalteromonas sp. SG45-5]|uniref:sodium/glutamate symporter n=1 Tax=unclassified Pseudoalteromonas TaxID=194690 RepID=UPI0015FB65E1|nr:MULTISPECIES: sodium/glutamate symporter [unclassified Pseudoalteromonas]MBB1384737.1 sodium/glutamate symporter [Pseudoalteromonas sp. SG45-5]MBB1392612.1 sodium/glutamate symporter [Pseudoalteromonas sp. SG44-4]MBB1447612.1 sodium/glutamate symporter [Pseudoalteromonas sp. SG41-6]
MHIEISTLETLLVSLVILFSGYYLNSKIAFLKNNNIPEPVVGGICFSIIAAIVHVYFDINFEFNMALKTPLMTIFFTTVGLGASFSLLIKGGPKVVLFLGVATIYLLIQNAIGVSIALASGMEPLMGLIGGSVTLSGGHGNGATYADLFINEYGMHNSVFELAMAAATFGLILGGLTGGPVSKRLIKKYNLKADLINHDQRDDTVTFDPEDHDLVTPKKMMETLFIILLCMYLGKVGYDSLRTIDIILPAFLIPLLFGVIFTNVTEFTKIYHISRACIDLWGTMALSIFLAMALMSLKIWELISLAGPMIFMILVQALMLMLFAYFITFRVMGKNYNAAIIAGGHCGFGLGATPTAVANMESLVSRYGPSPQAFLVVPLVGAFFIDITNALIIQLYLSFPFISG